MRTSQMLRLSGPLIVVALIAIVAIVRSFSFDEVPAILAQGIQPAAFPRLVCGLILVLAVIAFVEDIRHPPPRLLLPPPVFFATVLAIVVFGVLVAVGDFLLALMLITAGIAAVWGERRPLVLLGLGIVAPILVVLLFDLAFQARFPRGFLLDLYYG